MKQSNEPVSVKGDYALYIGFEWAWLKIVTRDGQELNDGTPEFDAVFEAVFPEWIY